MVLALQLLCAATSILFAVLVLAHRGNGGGLSDLLGGTGGSTARSSATAQKNLTRATLVTAGVWVVSIVAVALVTR